MYDFYGIGSTILSYSFAAACRKTSVHTHTIQRQNCHSLPVDTVRLWRGIKNKGIKRKREKPFSSSYLDFRAPE
jgi:hypothetical protein